MIKLNRVSKKIAEKQVLNDLCLAVDFQKVTAVCGPNGAGKTTLVRLILGLLQPDSGVIQLNTDLRAVSFLFHRNCLFSDLSLMDNLGFFLGSKKMTLDRDLLNFFLKEFSLAGEVKARVSTFSAGMLQKANIIRALLEKPELLILDEPTANLDPAGRIQFRRILKTMTKERGVTVLYTSHLLSEMEKVADKVVILNRGKIAWQGDLKTEIQGKPIDLEAKFVSVLGLDP